MALTKAANPAALLASPAAVGKLFSLTIFSGIWLSLGADASPSSTFLRSARSSRKHAWVRAPETSCGLPLSRSESEDRYEGEHEAVVWVRRSSCERVTERDELVGRFSFGSRLPQYLITAMLTGAVVLAR